MGSKPKQVTGDANALSPMVCNQPRNFPKLTFSEKNFKYSFTKYVVSTVD